MTAPRIKVRVDAAPGVPPIIWYCDHGPTLGLCAGGETYTISAAADAGRAHLRRAHDKPKRCTHPRASRLYGSNTEFACDDCGWSA